ncbi:MAG: outer membrane lipid asymmetry maintenance protein MlaD [Candidatus Tectomicrobia bacterium]|uniref:Outer membrane lipid asymmetry maintenance protein MlaD n=1 Tax=Tectimicrobiota bacterium TaxID=2528274 RepID=A0A932ZSK0_UNCTE|nr:outer membrane lipid asymmetry maintenance protein MlaD [Candidatus Tectomicrobia bacterium]MBI3024237.1 outer membrane lipid asymmetry maintenance protein MlaD [Candidatus Tectomicrobia bacterium]MBI4250878.1 outer membrane lipid asymmetry maintenance protein MlaD [Candidatus Tectomicrobia bacterium]
MSQRGMELTVGVFVLAGLAALAYLSIRLGGLDLFETGTYDVTARFSSAAGLREGATVEIAGVQVGRVKAIGLEQNEALITLRLRSSVKLTQDTIASIRTKGILGDKYISISLGGAPNAIAPGGRIRETEPPVDIEKLIGQFIYGKVK